MSDTQKPENEPPRVDPSEIGEIGELARHAPGRLGQRLAGKTHRQLAELALRLPAAERLELLLHAPEPMRLVRSLPDAELYLTVREVGPEDALPLLALASANQIQHLLDLESWRLDRFDADRAGAWLALLAECGLPTVRRFLRAADDEQLALLFQRWFRPDAIEADDAFDSRGPGRTETGDEFGMVSPDGNYRFRPTIPEHVPAIRAIADLLFLQFPQRYQQMLWTAEQELPSDLEEQAARWRLSRLEEHGFPPWDEALAVYAPPSGVRGRTDPPEPEEPDGLAAPRAPLRLLPPKSPLSLGLEELPDELRERVLAGAIAVANRLLVAEGADTGEPAQHTAALELALGYVSIALRARGTEQGPRLARTVAEIPVLELFREGYARAIELQAQARRLVREGWAANHPHALDLLDEPLRGRMMALLEPRPRHLVFDRRGGGRRRGFQTMEELDEARVSVELADLLGRALVHGCGADLDRLLGTEGAPKLRFGALLLTALAWHTTSATVRIDPLPAAQDEDFRRRVAGWAADPQSAARAIDALVANVARTAVLSARESALLTAFARSRVEPLTAGRAAGDPNEPPDPWAIPLRLD